MNIKINILHYLIVVIKIMKKISWIASYPKSGNTYVRLLLSAYFYSSNGVISDFKSIDNIFKISGYKFLQNIKDIPKIEDFIENPKLIAKFWSLAQVQISSKIKNNLFIKTHDCMATISGNKFTNKNLTKCFIYVVRDPRSIAVSYSYHTGYDIDKTISYLINKSYIINYTKEEMTVPELVSSWSVHYNSWKNFIKEGNGIIIKYEDLVTNPKKEFKKILLFLNEVFNFEMNEEKLINSTESTKFDKLKRIESQTGFKEKSLKSERFFRKGVLDEWKEVLSKEQVRTIEENFENEMLELKYIN